MGKVPFEGKSLMTENIESFYFNAVVACEVLPALDLKNPWGWFKSHKKISSHLPRNLIFSLKIDSGRDD